MSRGAEATKIATGATRVRELLFLFLFFFPMFPRRIRVRTAFTMLAPRERESREIFVCARFLARRRARTRDESVTMLDGMDDCAYSANLRR